MSGNPITDQMAATIRDKRITAFDPGIETAIRDFVQEIVECAPGVPPAAVGEILLHTAAHLPTILRRFGKDDTEGAKLTCNLIAAFGQELYTEGNSQ